ncbi:FHA domain-containing protein [Microbulbifer epialgicus]|uniref:FHA domain-containing protein n=1 Tax=Microbulbifer epialgicus TaxID=393907 RepID=A0ABV4NUY7_9GAMM
MPKRKVIKVGRSKEMDIRIVDATVSRHHLEIVITEDGNYFLTDCGSLSGTSVFLDKRWCLIKQEFVGGGQRIRIGSIETCIDKLLSIYKSNLNDTSLLLGAVKRNPNTGAIEKL